MTDPYDDARTYSSVAQYNYCPTCGTKTETEEFVVSSLPDGTATKYNTEVVCPNCDKTLIHR